MLIFQFFVSFLQDVFPQFSFDYLKGILEFSSGSLKIIHQSKKMLPFVCFFLSFSGFSVMMQADNLLEAIPYSFKKIFSFSSLSWNSFFYSLFTISSIWIDLTDIWYLFIIIVTITIRRHL